MPTPTIGATQGSRIRPLSRLLNFRTSELQNRETTYRDYIDLTIKGVNKDDKYDFC